MRIECSECETGRESPAAKSGQARIPRGWKQIGDRVYCPKCKLTKYALRAITIPVAACDWASVIPVVRGGIRDCTRCSNWLVSEYYSRDPLRIPADKLPKWTLPYMYPDARILVPDLEPMSLVSIINTVQSKYRAFRFDLWRGAKSLPTFRDVPVPINSQASRIALEKQRWTFEFRYSGSWYSLQLRQGLQFARQIRALQSIQAGETEPGEAALYWRDKSLILKIAGWFRRGESAGCGEVKARTASDAFLIAVSSSGAIWKLNGDHVRRWIVGAENQQQRLREDLKAERRFPKYMREGIVDRMGALSRQRSDRLQSWSHESSMQIVNWTKRQHAVKLVWDDQEQSQVGSLFPWFAFREMLKAKCEMAGIEFEHASGREIAETAEPLASPERSES